MDILGMLTVPNWLLYILIFITVAYKYYTWRFGFFTSMGIPGPKPYAVFGNMDKFYKYGFADTDKSMIDKYGKIYGMFFGRNPRLVIGDVNILRRIMIKDFPAFQDRDKMVLRGIIKSSLFDAREEFWRDLRHFLTPAFTTGKLKQMMPLIRNCGDRFVANIKQKSENNEEFEARQHCGEFTMDVISSTAFGLDVDSQKNKNDPFVHHILKIVNFDIFSPWLMLIAFTPFLIPLAEALGVHSLPNDSYNFFCKVMRDTLKERRKGNGVRVDILQLMLDTESHLQEADEETNEDLKANSGQNMQRKTFKLTEDEIIAQAILFFIAGYDTTASTMAFLLYELAVNQHIQDKVFTEINMVTGGKDPTYEDLHRLSYMEMCINETLRLFPPLSTVDRWANQDFECQGIKIPKDTLVSIPVRAIHLDPEGWEDPERFDPERFTPEAKAARDSMYFMPFGLGPRHCIGMRLALLEMKLTLVNLLRKYRIITCDKTQIPVKLKKTFFMNAEKGLWVKAEARE